MSVASLECVSVPLHDVGTTSVSLFFRLALFCTYAITSMALANYKLPKRDKSICPSRGAPEHGGMPFTLQRRRVSPRVIHTSATSKECVAPMPNCHPCPHPQRLVLCGAQASGPVVCMVWSGVNVVLEGRKMLGATKPSDSAMGTIRGDFCVE